MAGAPDTYADANWQDGYGQGFESDGAARSIGNHPEMHTFFNVGMGTGNPYHYKNPALVWQTLLESSPDQLAGLLTADSFLQNQAAAVLTHIYQGAKDGLEDKHKQVQADKFETVVEMFESAGFQSPEDVQKAMPPWWGTSCKDEKDKQARLADAKFKTVHGLLLQLTGYFRGAQASFFTRPPAQWTIVSL